MTLITQLKVGNNITLGYDRIHAESNCSSFLHLRIPIPTTLDAGVTTFHLELSANELLEFLVRTQKGGEWVVNFASQQPK